MNAATFSAPLSIDLGERSYDIVIGTGLLSDPRSFDVFAAAVSRAVIVTNTTVAPIYAKRLQQTLARKYSQVDVTELPDGEAYKSGETLDSIFTALLQMGADRKTWLFALGGGVVGDITGFAAACYMRGVPYVQVPTTLLAQVDSSVGGKTAINHPLGKNMIGAFYQPRLVVADIETLRTLPENQLRAGLAEVIKYGPIYDADFLRWLDAHLDALLSLDSQAIMYAVRRSCEIKAEIVAQDECENGIRAILNLGHTFGHAIETGAGYGAWLHGEAVACGMVMAADLSCRLGLLARDQYDALRALIVRAGLPVLAPAWGVERYLELMLRDKKNEGRGIRFVLLEGLGHAVVRSAPQNLVEAVLHAHQQPAG